MNLKCPYCGCEYDIDTGSLPAPAGDDRLGYGWWLRCFRCHKKWWTPNADAQMNLESQLSISEQDRIDRLSRFRERVAKQGHAHKSKTWKLLFKFIVCIAISSIFVGGIYFNRSYIYNYVTQKAIVLRRNLDRHIILEDVSSKVDDLPGDKLKVSVSGKVTNNDQGIVKITGIRIKLIDLNTGDNVLYWDELFKKNYLVGRESLGFNFEKELGGVKAPVKVDIVVM